MGAFLWLAPEWTAQSAENKEISGSAEDFQAPMPNCFAFRGLAELDDGLQFTIVQHCGTLQVTREDGVEHG